MNTDAGSLKRDFSLVLETLERKTWDKSVYQWLQCYCCSCTHNIINHFRSGSSISSSSGTTTANSNTTTSSNTTTPLTTTTTIAEPISFKINSSCRSNVKLFFHGCRSISSNSSYSGSSRITTATTTTAAAAAAAAAITTTTTTLTTTTTTATTTVPTRTRTPQAHQFDYILTTLFECVTVLLPPPKKKKKKLSSANHLIQHSRTLALKIGVKQN